MAFTSIYEAIQSLIVSLGLIKGGPPLATAAQVLINSAGTSAASVNSNGDLVIATKTVVSTLDAITAHAGGGQSLATPLTGIINRVTTVATAADSVKLPAATAGRQITVINSAAANSMNIFPASGENINDGANDAAVAQVAGKSAHFACAVVGKWHRVLSA